MKTMKAICTAAILALALSIPAFGGDISTPGFANNGGGSGAPIAGDISSPGFADLLWALVAVLP